MLAICVAAQNGEKLKKKDKKLRAAEALPTMIWHDPGPVETLDLVNGSGGKEDAPDPNARFTFIEEVMHGWSPKFDVKDEHGVRWRAKLGREPQSETAATRLLYAAGFFVREDYYFREIKVDGLPNLKRGHEWTSPDGVVRSVRLERHDREHVDGWSWYQNPFVGTREFNALRLMMAFVNNWDLKSDNNTVFVTDTERDFGVGDLGEAFGKTGNEFTRSESKARDFAKAKFIDRKGTDFVDFAMHTRPFFLIVFDFPYYRERTHMQDVTKHVPVADARWVGQRLAQLSDQQIRDCFVAAGYSAEDVGMFASAVKKRIAELNAL